jgi:hypothetical protein
LRATKPSSIGTTEATDLHKTEVNRGIVRGFVDEVLIGRDMEQLAGYEDRRALGHARTVAPRSEWKNDNGKF